MFTKVRNKFLTLNLTLTAAVLLAAFVVVYIATYTRTQREIETTLEQNRYHTVTISSDEMAEEEAFSSAVIGLTVETISPDSGLAFNVVVDTDGNVVEVISAFGLPPEIYEQAAALAWANPDSNAPLSLDGRKWRYMVSPFTLEYLEMSSMYVSVSVPQYQITFLDVTDDYATLAWLLVTLAGSFIALMVLLYFITRHFANRAIRPLAEAWDKQARFIADASHELKTPLSIIRANCDVLLASPGQSVRSQLKWVDRIVQGTERMATLVGDMLTLAQMEGLQGPSRPAPFDAGKLAEDVLLSMEAAALEKDIEISQDIQEDAVLCSDEEALRQVLVILLDNAIKYTPRHGTVSLSLRREGHHILVRVVNSGAGIRREDLPKLFDRFYRGDPARAFENAGHGLGLAIAKATLDKLGGSIHAESEPGAFTTFTVSLPDRKQK